MLVLQMCKIAAYRAELLLLGIGSVLSVSGFQSMNRTEPLTLSTIEFVRVLLLYYSRLAK